VREPLQAQAEAAGVAMMGWDIGVTLLASRRTDRQSPLLRSLSGKRLTEASGSGRMSSGTNKMALGEPGGPG
jgi:hypothetical protein